TVLDPFAGGGSIPFEAMRVGIDTIANDYNPMATLIEKATLEYPKKYGDKLYKDVENGLKWIFEETKKEMDKYYLKHDSKDVAAYIWAWSVKCPKCGFDTPLVGQWSLLKKEGKSKFIEPTVENKNLILALKSGEVTIEGTCADSKGNCLNPNCGASIPKEIIRSDIAERDKEILLALVLIGRKGKEYVLADKTDILQSDAAKNYLDANWDSFRKNDLFPFEEIPPSNDVRSRNFLTYWHRILNPRQKLLFITILQKIHEYNELLTKEHDEEYRKAIMTYLSFIFGKHIDYNCRSTTWIRSKEIISSTMGRRGISMMWDHTEVNPFVKGSGTLITINKTILDAVSYAEQKISKRGSISITNNSITQLEQKVDLIICDPPYYDDVQYAELSEFFYLWERRALEEFALPKNTPKMEDLSVGGSRNILFFKKLFKLASNSCFKNLTPNGILVMIFAQSSVDAWDFVVNSLQKSGFRITATWPVHTESSTSQGSQGNASIMSSIIIVARKRKSDKSGYIEEIQDEVRDHLMKRLDDFWKCGLRGADLTVSAMGSTLDIITQYSDIKSYTGEMQIKDVLELVQKYVAQYVLNRYMKNASVLDAATSFYLYTRLSQLNGMPFDTANLIAKSMNVDLKLFEKQGLIESRKKGKAPGITLLNCTNREVNGKQSLIDCVHLVMATFAQGGYTEAERELATISYSRNEIKDVLEAFLSLPTEDPERQIAQKILERIGQSFPKQGQTGLDNF
ncbi:DUF1156 domain-containing protein, partial [Macellibacteroides fermentans]|uniref:DUF1156 domain-containing protein n=1 Tax=Macellibacteroides fermentans TaxID=879969 RepID=UPI00406D3221